MFSVSALLLVHIEFNTVKVIMERRPLLTAETVRTLSEDISGS